MAIHHIKLEDLNEAFIEKLRKEYMEEDFEVFLEVRAIPNKDLLSEKVFWSIINRIDMNKGEDEAISSAIQHLASLPVSHIYQFEDFLAKKLFALDTQKHAEYCGKNAYGTEKHFSVDIFLYARCFIVAKGKIYYNQVLDHPDQTPKNETFELLLNLASKAYKEKTGKVFEYIPPTIYETFNNTEGWNNSGLIEKILFE